MTTYYVSELFSTIQGEGPSLGHPAFFIRLQGCDIGCDRCDTKYTWKYGDGPGVQILTEDQIYCKMLEHVFRGALVVITGGEPTDQDLGDLINLLCKNGYDVEIETAGKHAPKFVLRNVYPTFNSQISVNLSPKLDCMSAKVNTHAHLDSWASVGDIDVVFKFVVGTDQDIEKVKELAAKHFIHYSQIVLMPEGLRKEEVEGKLAWLAEHVKNLGDGISMTTRLHVSIYGAKRGV